MKLPGSDIPDIPVPPEYMPSGHTWPRHEAFARAYRRELSLIILGEDKIFANTAATATGHIINPPPSTKVYNDLQKVVGKQRRIDCIQRDGNCLFRAMSKELLGHEKFHYLIRLLLVQFITANSTQFQEYHNEGKIEAHASRMSNLCVWGTSVELYSAATLFKTDIYVLSKQPNSPQYKWLCYHPLPMSRFSIHEPELVENCCLQLTTTLSSSIPIKITLIECPHQTCY